MHGVVLKHVLEIVRGDERVVDGFNVGEGLPLRRPGHEPSDPPEAIDPDPNGAGRTGSGVRSVDDVDELRLEGGAPHQKAVDVRLACQL